MLLAGGFIVLFALLPHALVGDDLQRFSDIQALLHDADLSGDRYSLVMPLLSSPFLLLGSLLGSPEWWAARFNVIVVAAGSYLAWQLVRDRVDATLYRRLLLVLLFASYLTNRLRDYNAEVLTATLIALGILCLVTDRHVVLGWGAIVLGVVNTPGALLGLVAIAMAVSLHTRRLRNLLPVLVAVALIMTEAWARRGGPFVSGYEGDHGFRTLLPYSGRPGFSYPFVLGVLSILFSFGRGLVLFAPGLLLWLGGRTRRLARPFRYPVTLMLLFVAGLVLVYAKWWAWYGGISWGPRFFLFAALPASLLIAVRQCHAGRSATADAITLAALGLSAWVAIAGVLEDPATLAICAGDGFSLEAFCWYVPEFTGLFRPISQIDPTPVTAVVSGYCVLVAAYLAAPLVPAPARAAWGRLGALRGGWRL